MSEQISTNSWYCQKCGTWVPAGTYHVCGQSPVQTYRIDKQDRIIELLEKILAELKRRK